MSRRINKIYLQTTVSMQKNFKKRYYILLIIFAAIIKIRIESMGRMQRKENSHRMSARMQVINCIVNALGKMYPEPENCPTQQFHSLTFIFKDLGRSI